VLGTSCCGPAEFAEAVELVGRRRDVAAALVTHEFTLEQAPEAIAYAMANPAEVLKAVVRVDG
jgi:threonine dehydrogenase-like Zn-dependent dehydrogenase